MKDDSIKHNFKSDIYENPCVSVIVLTYNHERYIARALDSILMQKGNFSFEILIGDDASQDGTVKVLKEYKEKYPQKIRLFLNTENIGATKNSYQLLINAKGKYLATCEGDDYWTDPEKIKYQIQFLKEHPKMVGCSHYCTVVDENEKKWRHQQLSWIHYKDEFTLEDFSGLFMPGQPSTFLRRNLIREMSDLPSFYIFHRQIGDRTLMLLYLLQGNFGLIHKPMSCYRKAKKRKVSLTQTGYSDKLEGWQTDYMLIKRYEELCREHGREIIFHKGRNTLLVKAIAWYFFKRDKRYRQFAKKVVESTNSENGHPVKFMINFLSYLLNRCLDYIRN